MGGLFSSVSNTIEFKGSTLTIRDIEALKESIEMALENALKKIKRERAHDIAAFMESTEMAVENALKEIKRERARNIVAFNESTEMAVENALKEIKREGSGYSNVKGKYRDGCENCVEGN
jgi:F0F1-type ATP synthase membrane subunit b/b'